MSIRTKIDFSGITSDHIVTSDNKKYIHEDDEIFNSLKDEIAACENAQVQTEIATLQILEIKEETKVIANEAIDTATERAETAAENAETAVQNAEEIREEIRVIANEAIDTATERAETAAENAENAQALAETAAINALEAERNVTEFSETFAKLDEYNRNVVEPHITDQTIHITNDEHESLQELISVSEKIPLVNQNNTFEEKTTFTNDVIVSNGNILLLKSANIKYLDDGEVTISSGASGFPIFDGIPKIVSNSAIYNVGVIDGDINLSGMYFDGDETIVQSCEVWFTTGSQLYNITWPSNLFWIDYDDGNMPQLLPNMKYRIVLRREIDDIIASISHFYSVR